jgi:hypothetical protein
MNAWDLGGVGRDQGSQTLKHGARKGEGGGEEESEMIDNRIGTTHKTPQHEQLLKQGRCTATLVTKTKRGGP